MAPVPGAYEFGMEAVYLADRIAQKGQADAMAGGGPRPARIEAADHVLGVPGDAQPADLCFDVSLGVGFGRDREPEPPVERKRRGHVGDDEADEIEPGSHERSVRTAQARNRGSGLSFGGGNQKVRMFVAIGLGWPEMIVILVVLLVLFGAKRLPDLARSLGSSVKELQKGIEEGLVDDEAEDAPDKK